MAQLVIYDRACVAEKPEEQKKEFIKQKCNSAAQSIFDNLDNGLKKRYNVSKIVDLIFKSDGNEDGIITSAEAETVCDKDNIFKLSVYTTEQETATLQGAIYTAQKLDGIIGIEKSFTAPDAVWRGALGFKGIKEKYVLTNLTKEGFIEMFKEPEVMKYYETSVRKNKNCATRMKELFNDLGISKNEIQQIGFSSEALKELL